MHHCSDHSVTDKERIVIREEQYKKEDKFRLSKQASRDLKSAKSGYIRERTILISIKF